MAKSKKARRAVVQDQKQETSVWIDAVFIPPAFELGVDTRLGYGDGVGNALARLARCIDSNIFSGLLSALMQFNQAIEIEGAAQTGNGYDLYHQLMMTTFADQAFIRGTPRRAWYDLGAFLGERYYLNRPCDDGTKETFTTLLNELDHSLYEKIEPLTKIRRAMETLTFDEALLEVSSREVPHKSSRDDMRETIRLLAAMIDQQLALAIGPEERKASFGPLRESQRLIVDVLSSGRRMTGEEIGRTLESRGKSGGSTVATELAVLVARKIVDNDPYAHPRGYALTRAYTQSLM